MHRIYQFDCAMCCDTGTYFDILEVEKSCTSCDRGGNIEPLRRKAIELSTDHTLPSDIRKRFESIFTVLGLPARPCKRCGRIIYFVGKKPYTDDGVSHYVDCPKASDLGRPNPKYA
ncbi:MAG: hypothetical protein ACPGXK_00115 [Phycisphaerae bacterium]